MPSVSTRQLAFSIENPARNAPSKDVDVEPEPPGRSGPPGVSGYDGTLVVALKAGTHTSTG